MESLQSKPIKLRHFRLGKIPCPCPFKVKLFLLKNIFRWNFPIICYLIRYGSRVGNCITRIVSELDT